MLDLPSRIPRAAYRLQFTPEFGFEQACRLAPYLAQLGISDIYASPLFQASSSSTHGYDVNDYNRISEALGGRRGLEGLSASLRAHGLGLILDFVPNHMGIDGEHNAWWSHVLENGSQSRFAAYFDIEWHPRLERLNDRVLVPMLAGHYGTELIKGSLSLKWDNRGLFIRYGSLRLPVRPHSYRLILEEVDNLLPSGDGRKARLRDWIQAIEHLPAHDLDDRDEQLARLKNDLAIIFDDRALQTLLATVLDKINGSPGDGPSFALLHELLESQHYRLAYWKVGAHEVNYRRFFAVDTLVGLKMEDPQVFAATHRLLGELIASQVVSGIRLDHIDGLWNPAQYFSRLEELVRTMCSDGGPMYTLIEKILASDEQLPKSWAIHGTTGYEFAANLIDVFLDSRDEPAWTQIYQDFTGEQQSSRDLTYADKLFILQEIFPNAVANLAIELDALIEPDWQWRDLSLHDLETALQHLLACLSVYRTYRMPDEEMAAAEKKRVWDAVDEGIRRNPCVDPVPLNFLGRVITGDYPPPHILDAQRGALQRWVCKLQQATGAVMAKSVEDTHFFRYVRMMGANEVGSHPSHFGQPVVKFHEANFTRQEQTPLSLLTTSTHDTKMSEDARARLFALAELPNEWNERLLAWHDLNHKIRSKVDRRMAPDSREEYLLYQAMLAAWPLNPSTPDDTFRSRLKAYFRKAQGEAKLNTAWTYPHEEWHAAGEHFIDGIFVSGKFLESFLPFAERIAHRGMIFSLAQTILRLTSPGVPDIYQGNETWDFSLVDPDNRRPVDFAARRELLARLDSRPPDDLLRNWQDGGIKMQVIRALLHCRKDFPELFAKGEYLSLQLEGNEEEHMVAFQRRYETMNLIVIVPRRLGTMDDHGRLAIGNDLRLPISKTGQWTNIFTGRKIDVVDSDIGLSTILSDWPVAVLLSTDGQVRQL